MNRNKVIARAQELIRNGWTQHYFARNAKDQSTGPYADDATSYCVVGAVARALYEQDGLFADPTLRVDNFLGFDTCRKLSRINNTRKATREQVLAALEALKQ